MQRFEPTAAQVAARIADAKTRFLDLNEAEAAADICDDRRRELKAKFDELAKRDKGEFRFMVGFAQDNAADTMRENGITDFDGPDYWQIALGTLEMYLDCPEEHGFTPDGDLIEEQ